MAATKEELIERAQLVRLYEASTKIAVPSELDLRFRTSLMFKLAGEFRLQKRPPLKPPAVPGPGDPPRGPAKGK